MEQVRMKQIGENTWQFTEQFLGEDVYCYLLTGTEKALLIDTAYGFSDIAGAVRELTDMPLSVVNTHGHFDHISGNRFFSEVSVPDKDLDLYEIHNDQSELEKMIAVILGGGEQAEAMIGQLRPVLSELTGGRRPEISGLPECGYYELGKRRVEIINTPGHTQGSISLLDRENGWLFSGDTCGDEGMLLHFPEATSVREFHDTIRNIRRLVNGGDITRNYPCHQTSPAPLAKLECYDRLLDRMERGDLSEDEWATGAAHEDGITIQFDPERIMEESK